MVHGSDGCSVKSTKLDDVCDDIGCKQAATLLHWSSAETGLQNFLLNNVQDVVTLLLPVSARNFYPLLAASCNMNVKPLILHDIVLVNASALCYQAPSPLMDSLISIVDKQRIITLLSQQFSDITSFSPAVTFQYLVGLEGRLALPCNSNSNSNSNSDSSVESNKLPGELDKSRSVAVTVAVGVTAGGTMYLHYSDNCHQGYGAFENSEITKQKECLLTEMISKALLYITRKNDQDNVTENFRTHIYASLHAADITLKRILQTFSDISDGIECSDIYFDFLILNKSTVMDLSKNDRFDKTNSDNTAVIELKNIENIFLLMGQSNMAGRGDVNDLKPSDYMKDYCAGIYTVL